LEQYQSPGRARTGVEIVIAERNRLAGLTLPRGQVADLHRALGRYLEGKS
jgi:hypothetical protein